MDMLQTVISVGAVVATAVLSRVKKSGHDEKRMESVEDTQKVHGQRLDEHDDRFDDLNTRFVPRPELQETMGAIRKSQDRQERMLEALILPRVRPIGTDGVGN